MFHRTRIICCQEVTAISVIDFRPWNAQWNDIPEPKPAPKERPDGIKLARHYQALISGTVESRAALARYLGVNRARVTQALNRLNSNQMAEGSR